MAKTVTCFICKKQVLKKFTTQVDSPAVIHDVGYAISPTKFAVQIDSDFTVVM